MHVCARASVCVCVRDCMCLYLCLLFGGVKRPMVKPVALIGDDLF